MAGLAIAALLGSGAAAAAGTAAIVSSAVTGGTMLYSTGRSFSEASKARGRQAKAERDADIAAENARKKINVNTAEQLSVPKEPYELQRRAALVQGAAALQAGVEGESRGAAATAGRVQMAQQQQQAEIAAAQAQQMFEIDQLKAQEDARIAQQLAAVELEEAKGASLAARYAEEDKAAYLKEAFAGLAQIGSRALEGYAAGDFDKQNLDEDGNVIPRTDRFGMTREQRKSLTREQLRDARGAIRDARKGGQTFGPGESASQLLDDLARGPEVDLGSRRQQRRSANQSVGVLAGPGFNRDSAEAIGGVYDFVTGYDVDGIPGSAYQDYVPPGRTLSPAETRQLNRANREIATANRQNQRELDRLEGQPILPTQRQLDREMTQQRRLGQQDARDIQRVLDTDARARSRQQQPGLPPPMTLTEEMAVGGSSQFNPFRGGDAPVSRQELEDRVTRNARLEGAGPVDTSPAGPINTDVLMDAEIRRATERRGGMSFIPNDPLAADMAAFYGEDPPARTPVGPRMEETGGGDPMEARERKVIPLSNTTELIAALGSEAPSDIRENLRKDLEEFDLRSQQRRSLSKRLTKKVWPPQPKAGPASAELAEVATAEHQRARTPLQWACSGLASVSLTMVKT